MKQALVTGYCANCTASTGPVIDQILVRLFFYIGVFWCAVADITLLEPLVYYY